MFDLFAKIEEDFSLLDRRAIFALVYTAIGLTCIYYLKNTEYLDAMASVLGVSSWAQAIESSDANNLRLLVYWVGISVLFYFVVPAIFLKFVFKKKLVDYGLNFNLEKGFGKLLFQCILVMLPLVYLMSMTSGFTGSGRAKVRKSEMMPLSADTSPRMRRIRRRRSIGSSVSAAADAKS